MSYSRFKTALITCLAILVASLALPVFADDDASDNGDRKKSKPGDIVVVDTYGDTVGVATDVWPDGGARIFTKVGGKDALVYLTLGQIGASWPPGPMLFFENPGCTGQVYARPEHVGGGWLAPKVVIVPGIVPDGTEPSFERLVYYAKTAEPGVYYPKSNLSPEGYCHTWDSPDTFAWPVEQFKACGHSYDLHECFPPPYELELR